MTQLRILVSGGVAACMLLGCGGGGTTPVARRLPSADLPAIALLPDDAFFVVRVDGEALRALPHWETLSSRFDDASQRDFFAGLGRFYFAAGHLREPGNEELARAAGWLGGRIPDFSVVVTGEAATHCERLFETAPDVREQAGYRIGTNDGISVAVKPGVCVLTLGSVIDERLARTTGGPALAHRLAGASRHGAGVVSAIVDIPAGTRAGFGAALRDANTDDQDFSRTSRLVWRVLGAMARGVDDAAWSLDHDAEGYVTRTRMRAADRDRGVMYRELVEVYREFATTVMNDHADEADSSVTYRHVQSTIDGMRIETTSDGFVVEHRLSDAAAAAMLRDTAEPARDVPDAVMPPAPPSPLVYGLEGAPADVVRTYEEHVDDLPSLDRSQRITVRLKVADAMSALGRFTSARQLLSLALEDAREEDAARELDVHLQRCQVEIAFGDGSAALAAASAYEEARDRAEYAPATYTVAPCRGVAMALTGDARGALAYLDGMRDRASLEGGDPGFLAVLAARDRVLAMTGEFAHAVDETRVACSGSSRIYNCSPLFVNACVAAAQALDAATVTAACDSVVGTAATWQPTELEAARLAVARCVAAVRLATDEDALCSAARDAVGSLGEGGSSELVPIDLAIARYRPAERAAALARVDEALTALGPDHPYRTQRAAIGGRRSR